MSIAYDIDHWSKLSPRKPTKNEVMRRELPYGIWRENDGSEVLFNRGYNPIWRRRPDGSVRRVRDPIGPNGKMWIHWVSQDHFFNDACTPWHDAKSRKRCEAILREWLAARVVDLRAVGIAVGGGAS
jgi:hypothetical protein